MTLMTLGEIYKIGKENLMSRDIGFVIEALDTGWVRANNRAALCPG